ncbi:MAG: hypothetical protein P8N28_01965 [Phycisphaerales bacterium]|nr:hypothetical protein [Phycisphaerales bacterium]
MNSPLHNQNESNRWNEFEPSLASMVNPLRIKLSTTADGWCVDISSLTPCDAMVALAREDLLEDSTILCGDGATKWVACVRGPVESGDAKAIVREVSTSASPLCADFRMQSVVITSNNTGVSAHVREYDEALFLASVALARYMSDLLGKQVQEPDLGVMDAMLHKTGTLSIKLIESEVFASFVDVGVSTSGSNEPADSSMIYDMYSDSWHCE